MMYGAAMFSSSAQTAALARLAPRQSHSLGERDAVLCLGAFQRLPKGQQIPRIQIASQETWCLGCMELIGAHWNSLELHVASWNLLVQHVLHFYFV